MAWISGNVCKTVSFQSVTRVLCVQGGVGARGVNMKNTEVMMVGINDRTETKS